MSINNPTTFTPEEFIEGKILEMNEACRVYRDMAKTIGADTRIADALMGRGSENDKDKRICQRYISNYRL